MPITVVPTAYGRPAAQALRDAVARAKRVDALAPVTVVVPTNSVGVSARRRLSSGDLGSVSDAGRGVVGVTFATVYRLAELLGAAELAASGRRPVSTPVVASAVRRALARNAGLFAPVAQHPATEEALVAAHRELADLDPAQLDVLAAQHPRAREVVRLHRATKSLLEREWHDEHDLMRAATDVVARGRGLVRELGTIVCFLPQRWSTPAARLVRALADQADVELIVGLTGSVSADAEIVASLRRVGVEVPPGLAAEIVPVAGTEVWNASDPDDEVRSIVRNVVDAMRAGVPLERMAVLYASDEPYARLLHEHFNLADIAHNGATTRSMSECALGRGLLRIFALADTDFARDDVCGLFAAAPVLDGRGHPIPAARWERLSRLAGVVRGVAEWSARLDAYAAGFDPDAEWGARERARVAALTTFVADLARDLDPDRMPRTWKGLAQFAHRIVRRYFGDENHRASWPPYEKVAARRVEAVIDRLATLDSIDPAPSIEVFRRTFELELDAARDRVGSLGDGVLVGPVGMALGVDLDRLWVCGLAEGLFPAVPRDDPLLGDRERGALGGELRLRSDRTTDDERALLAALASTTDARVCTYPRGDLRRSSEHVPSRFLARTLSALVPEHSLASYAHGASHVAFPANRHELEVRAAVAGEPWVEAETAVARGLELTRARASRGFTRFDGNLAHLADQLSNISPAHPSA